MRTSTYYSESNANARTGSNASTPISHTRVVCDGPRPPDIDATAIHRYLDNKVIGVRTATFGADPPSFTLCPTGCTLQDFYPATPADVEGSRHSCVNCPVNSVPGTLFTGQLNVFLQSTADLAAEAKRRHFVAISVPVVQQLPRAWHCAVHLQIGLHYATAEESRP